MTKRKVSFSDLSGQMAGPTDGLIPLVVTDYPNSDPDQRIRIEVTKEEMEKSARWPSMRSAWKRSPPTKKKNAPATWFRWGSSLHSRPSRRWKKSWPTRSRWHRPSPNSRPNDLHAPLGLMAAPRQLQRTREFWSTAQREDRRLGGRVRSRQSGVGERSSGRGRP